MPKACTTNHMAARNRPAAMNVTFRSAAAGLVRSSTFIMPMPTSDATSPTITVKIGSETAAAREPARAGAVAAMAIVATMEPT